jgi:hypothetical protein
MMTLGNRAQQMNQNPVGLHLVPVALARFPSGRVTAGGMISSARRARRAESTKRRA